MSNFTTTRWSLVLRAGFGSVETAAQALEELCRIYRYPIYAYSRWLKDSHEDAEDLTQSFFAELLEKNFFAKARPEKGKFRSFLLTSFRLHRAKHRERITAQKRGGGANQFSIDNVPAEERFAAELRDPALTPDQQFDRAWALTILDEAHGRLAAEYRASGKEPLFKRLGGLLQSPEDSPTYAVLAAQLGKSEPSIKMDVSRMKARFGKLLRSVVEETVSEPEEVEEELRYLLRLLSN